MLLLYNPDNKELKAERFQGDSNAFQPMIMFNGRSLNGTEGEQDMWVGQPFISLWWDSAMGTDIENTP